MWRSLLILLIFGALTPRALATCDDYRLDKEGGVMEDMPILNQRNVGTCYAQAGAQVLTAKLRLDNSQKFSKIMVSPLSLAMGFREYIDRNISSRSKMSIKNRTNIIEGENTYFPLNASGQFPICEFKDVEDRLAGPDINGIFHDLNEALEWIFTRNIGSDVIDRIAVEVCARMNPQARNLADIKAVLLEAIKQNTPMKFIRHMVEGECKRIDIPKDLVKISGPHPAMSGSEIETMAFIDKMLDKRHKIPISIDYCSSVLTESSNSRGREIFFSSAPNSQERENGCRPHASVLIGRRRSMNPSGGATCEYLIRNSWGPTCEPYASEYSDKCENGQIWVARDALLRNILQANSLE